MTMNSAQYNGGKVVYCDVIPHKVLILEEQE